MHTLDHHKGTEMNVI